MSKKFRKNHGESPKSKHSQNCKKNNSVFFIHGHVRTVIQSGKSNFGKKHWKTESWKWILFANLFYYIFIEMIVFRDCKEFICILLDMINPF